MRISDWSSDVCSSDLRARLGSHDGAATSRNASTLPGLIMAETMRPKPKMSPEASAMSSFLTVSKLHDVPSDVHSRSRCDEEEAGRGKRAGRKPRYSADAMAAGTTTPKPRPQSQPQADRKSTRLNY